MDFRLTDEQLAIGDLARDFARREIAPFVREYDEKGYYPREHLKRLAELGFLGGTLPIEYGGSGMDYTTLAVVLEELGYVCPMTAMVAGQPSCSLCTGLLLYGSEELKRRYLPPTLAGDLVGAVAVTEPHSGTDIVRMMETTARRDGDAYVLNGTKTWVSNCSNADWLITFGTIDKSHGSRGICAFIVDKDLPGVTVHPFHGTVGSRTFASGEVALQNVRVPVGNRVGEEGEGYKVMMAGTEIGRLSCAARAVGQIRACLDAATSYAQDRQVFGQAIGHFQLIQEKIANMRVNLEAARLISMQLAWMKDQGVERAQEQASIAKLFATDALMQASMDAVQILGAYGCSNEYPVGRYFRDAKFMQIYDGTSEIHRVIIAEHELGYRKGSRA